MQNRPRFELTATDISDDFDTREEALVALMRAVYSWGTSHLHTDRRLPGVLRLSFHCELEADAAADGDPADLPVPGERGLTA